jgi:hypothetical protein
MRLFHFLFPSDPLNRRLPDQMFLPQLEALKQKGFGVSLVSLEDMAAGPVRVIPALPTEAAIVYRGWMLSPAEYNALHSVIVNAGGTPFITPELYLSTHHLPNWYPHLAELTPETAVFSVEDDLTTELARLNWGRYFVKDYVKSLKTSRGSFLDNPAEIRELLTEMERYRGVIEGGVCIRRVEDFLPDSELRYFVLNGVPFAPTTGEAILPLVTEVSRRITSPFYSVDVVQRRDGVHRVVEVGDGQVSDIVGWTPARFAEMWETMATAVPS